MATSKGFKTISIEIPNIGINPIDIKAYLILLTEYMGGTPERQEKILSEYPNFERFFSLMEEKIVPVLRQRMEIKNGFKGMKHAAQ